MSAAPNSDAPRFHISAGWIAAYVLLAAAIAVAMPFIKARRGEQIVYTKAAARLVEGEEFYRPEEGKAFTYPPFFAIPFVPLAGLDEPVRRGVWYFVNLLLMGGAIYLVARQAWPVLRRPDGSAGPARWIGVAVVAILSGRFVISPVEYQGHDMVVLFLAMLAIDAWGRGADGRAGVWAGLGAACKATPLLFLPIFVLQWRHKAVAAFVFVAVAATLLPDVMYPRDSGGLWVTAWYEKFISKVEIGEAAHAEGAWISWNLLNQSLSGTLYRLFTPVAIAGDAIFDVSIGRLDAAALKFITTAAQAAVVVFLVWVTWPKFGTNSDPGEYAFRKLGEGGAVLCGMLLLAPMSSKQHFCTLLVPIAFCVADYMYHRRDRVVGGALLVVLLAGTLVTKDLVGRPWGNALLACGSLTLCAIACLVASGRILLRRRREAAASLRADGPIAENNRAVHEMAHRAAA
jgi:hypothetical protein